MSDEEYEEKYSERGRLAAGLLDILCYFPPKPYDEEEFQKIMQEKLDYLVTDNETTQEIETLAGFCYEYGYEFTEEMLEFIEAHPGATREELWRCFDEMAANAAELDDGDGEWLDKETEDEKAEDAPDGE